MSPFIPKDELVHIFGDNLLENNELTSVLKQLKGEADVKPFECVGTIEEVNACLDVWQKTKDESQKFYVEAHGPVSFNDLLNQYDEKNNLPEQFESILKDNLFKNNN